MDVIKKLRSEVMRSPGLHALVNKTDIVLLLKIAEAANLVGDQILAGELISLENLKEIIDNSSLSGKIDWDGLQTLAAEMERKK